MVFCCQAAHSPARPPNEYDPVGGREGERAVQPALKMP